MDQKLKISRFFTFKAYKANKSEEIKKNAHVGEFLSKSECHYYCEKNLLDFIKLNAKENEIYLIYKISTVEDSNIEDMLIEQIFIKNNKINII